MTLTRLSHRLQLLLLTLLMLTLMAGCASNPLSTAGSLRVEVEVYKGPLSKNKRSQLGELVGVFFEAEKALHLFMQNLNQSREAAICAAGCNQRACAPADSDCHYLAGVMDDAAELMQLTQLWIYNQAYPDYQPNYRRQGRHQIPGSALQWYHSEFLPYWEKRFTDTAEAKAALRPILRKASKHITTAAELASRFSNKAFYWANAQIGQPINDPDIRRSITGFTLLASEYSNQINARTAVLLKQLDDPPREGYELALSDHLRDASTTAFLHLYDWYDRSDFTPTQHSELDVADRIKVAQELFADRYWTRINEVQANGQGNVSMALIKDEIGNWNLKSFENDPGKLLQAYRDLSLAGIKAITKIASSASGTESLALLGNLAQGNLGSTAAFNPNIDRIKSYHEQTLNQLRALQQAQGAALQSRKLDIEAKEQQLQAAQTTTEQSEKALLAAPEDASLRDELARARQEQQRKLEMLQAARAAITADAIRYIEAVGQLLREHRIRIETVSELSSGAADSAAPQGIRGGLQDLFAR